jgi:hypothetical protein
MVSLASLAHSHGLLGYGSPQHAEATALRGAEHRTQRCLARVDAGRFRSAIHRMRTLEGNCSRDTNKSAANMFASKHIKLLP